MDETSEAPNAVVGYGPVAAFITTIVTFFGSQLLAGVAIGFGMSAFFGWDEARINSWFEGGAEAQAVIIGLSGLFTLLMIGWFLKRRKTTFAQIGFGRPKASATWQAVLAFVVYVAIFLIILGVVSKLIPGLDLNQEQDLGFDYSAKESIWLLVVSLVIIPPIVEEIVMRGFLFTGLRTKMPFLVATIMTSILFGAAHLPSGKDGLLWVGAIDTFVLSLVLCYLREKTGSVWAGIYLHAIKNAVALIFLVKFIP